eukprot:CAMPEP_0195530884 /NCGR_PEP_ID=MMETSP0794_2-20130614/33991_1 /TAXON_ID=515487 /ORGANISM="Stephanopyxis turris, Strain CCMP 815" /LENGTH=131 /DNA_ID=CAMNT_0040662499 /DNA_START=80 /DNA_END=475 /DNA_ORIENTATION=-
MKQSTTEDIVKKAPLAEATDSAGRKSEDEENEGNTTEFINTGLRTWEVEREKWLGRKPGKNRNKGHASRWAVNVDVDEIIDCIFSNRWRAGPGGPDAGDKKGDNGSFPHPVPLPQMVDILVDLWEAEGLEI